MARRKEHDEEMKTVRSLVAKMKYEVVEMMVKLWRLMGCLVEKKRKKMMVEVVLWLLLLLRWRGRWRRE